MLPRHDEMILTDSAYRHGYDDDDVLEMLRGRCLVIRNRRGGANGHEILGRNAAGDYLLAAGRVIQWSDESTVLRVFHVDRMTPTERRRYQRTVRQ